MPGQTSRLQFYQRVPEGRPLKGAVVRLPEVTGWTWEGDLTDSIRIRLRREGAAMVSSCKLGDKFDWEAPRRATRPQAYAFYNANANPRGFRYVRVCGHASSGFPLVGLTAGWLPATLLGDGANWAGGRATQVRFHGTFCDPFDMVTHPPVMRQAPNAQAYPRYHGPPFARPGSKLPPRGRGGSTWTPGKVPWAAPMRPGGPPRPPRFQFPPLRQEVPGAAIVAGQAHFRGKLRPTPRAGAISVPSVELTVAAELVRPGDGTPPPRPLLSVVCVRWFDYWSDPAQSSDYSTLNDGVI